MSIKDKFKQIRDNYVIRQVERLEIPDFAEDDMVRYYIIFSGRVQHVGFRLEVYRLALRLGLTGWVKNLPNEDVAMEIQGVKDKIVYVVNFMKSLKRINIKKIRRVKKTVVESEQEFVVLSTTIPMRE